MQANGAVERSNFIFVMGPFADAGNKNLPDPGRTEGAHLVAAPVPAVEIADDANALSVGGPDGEAGAGHAVNGAQLRAEFVVNPALVPLAEEIQIGLTESGEEGIGIARASKGAGFVGNHQVVSIHTVGFGCGAFEDIGFRYPFEFYDRFVLFVDGLEFNLGGVRHKRPRDKARAVSEGMKSEQLMRRTLSCLDQTVNFVLGQSHGPDNITEAG